MQVSMATMSSQQPISAETPSFTLLDESNLTDEEAKGRIRRNNEALILAAAERTFAQSGFKSTTMAQIADEAGLPKANLHYYFGNKQTLYLHVLDTVLHDWLAPMDSIKADADPKAALESYVRQKMALSFARPDASRLFANELLQGAKVIHALLGGELRDLVVSKSAVIDSWIQAEKIRPIDSTHLFFSIWSMTQTYADFDIQIRAVTGDPINLADEQERATRHVLSVVFRACGLE